MENRVITIVSTASNDKKTVTTDAETLGELKRALDEKGIRYTGMTFMEALTHTEMASDDSILPRDVEYKGTKTNNLVFMLTSSQKKIKSGATRSEMLATIRENGLSKQIAEITGKNFVNCSNEELANALTSIRTKTSVAKTQSGMNLDKIASALRALADALYNEDIICESERDEIADALYVGSDPQVYSSSEIDSIISNC